MLPLQGKVFALMVLFGQFIELLRLAATTETLIKITSLTPKFSGVTATKGSGTTKRASNNGPAKAANPKKMKCNTLNAKVILLFKMFIDIIFISKNSMHSNF